MLPSSFRGVNKDYIYGTDYECRGASDSGF